MKFTNQQQRASSLAKSVGSDKGGGFLQLPTELLEEIYIFSETLSFPLVCRLFFYHLSNDYVRLRFCTRVFFLGNPDNLQSGVGRSLLQKQANNILAQRWFTNRFAKRMENEVLKMQENDIFYSKRLDGPNGKDIYTERHCPYTGGLVPMLGSNKLIAAKQVYLPTRLLCAPWSNDIQSFLRRLKDWGVRLNDADVDVCNEALKSAITSNNIERFSIYMSFRGEIDHELFNMVKSSGNDCLVVKVFLAGVNTHIASDITLSGQERSALVQWVNEGWAKGVVQRKQEGGGLKIDNCTAVTGRKEELKGSRPEGGAATLIWRPREDDGLFRAQLKRFFQQKRLVYTPTNS